MRVRASRRHEWLQSPASALGQGPDADRKKNSAEGIQIQRALARQSRSLLPSDRQYQLPADGRLLRHAASCNDRPLLSGLVPDARHRPAALSRVYLLDLELLSRRTKRNSPQNLDAHFPLHAVRHGRRHRYLHTKCASGPGSHRWKENRICPHPKIQDRRQERHVRRQNVQKQSRLDSLRRSFSRNLFRSDRRLRHHQRKLRHHSISSSLRMGLSLHRLHVPRPNLLRPSPLWRQRPRNAPRRLRRPRILAFRLFVFRFTCTGSGVVYFAARSLPCNCAFAALTSPRSSLAAISVNSRKYRFAAASFPERSAATAAS